jgi:transposase
MYLMRSIMSRLNASFWLLFSNYFCILADMVNVEGLTITEMAKMLGISYGTAKSRLVRGGIKPKTKEALYDESALEFLKNTPGKGRPPKAKPEAPATAKKGKK